MINRQIIDEDLQKLEELLVASLKTSAEFVGDVGEYIVTSGGKRLRPALLLMAARSGEKFNLARVLPLAAALELIHTASLVHDDVIDEANLRRGVPTANAKWGRRVSILAGDYIFAVAFRLVAQGGYDDFVSNNLANLVADLSVGEIVESREAYSINGGVDGYLWRIQKKTADFLTTCCLLGAMTGGVNKTDAEALAAYGHNIGMAFQIIDDVLDLSESAEQVGKPVGNDIRQGVITLPVIRALEVSSQRDELAGILQNAAMTGGEAERAVDIVRGTDGIAFARKYAEDYIKNAKAALPAVLPADIRDTFVEAADFIAERDY